MLVTEGEAGSRCCLRGSDPEGNRNEVGVEVVATDETAARRTADDLRRLALELNGYRGQVVSAAMTRDRERLRAAGHPAKPRTS